MVRQNFFVETARVSNPIGSWGITDRKIKAEEKKTKTEQNNSGLHSKTAGIT